jgi:adenine phosphoribosyltransferase
LHQLNKKHRDVTAQYTRDHACATQYSSNILKPVAGSQGRRYGAVSTRSIKMSVDLLTAAIRDVPDFPKPGIIFKDITPILSDPKLLRIAVDLFAEQHAGAKIDKIAIIDARGFIFGSALAYSLSVGLVPIRKAGKLPYDTYDESYDLEYGSAELSMHIDGVKEGERVVIIDDLLATGGTAAAAINLVEKAGGIVEQLDVLIELTFLNGRDKLEGYEIFAPIQV